MRVALVLALMLSVGALPGCLDAYDRYDGFDPDREYKNPGVFPGNYSFASHSMVLTPGPYKASEPEVVQLRSTLPAYPGVGETLSEGTVLITMAIWRPQNVTEPIPVIVDAGPYYEIGFHCRNRNDNPNQGCPASGIVNDTIDYAAQSTPFLLDNLLPHGYAVVQLAVRGTGTHGGCMDLIGPDEAHDLDQAITWLGEQPWSNGNVAMMGTSYDGSTPWEVAGLGNPHLKTIVPISGVPDIFDLMFHNGSAETRGLVMHNQVYWGFGFDDDFGQLPPSPIPPPAEPPLPPAPDPLPQIGQANGREPYQDLQNLLCPDVYEGSVMGGWATTVGSRGSETTSTYWTERDHQTKTLENYQGSILLIQGLQDWNVDPHQNIPFNAQLRAKGLEMKEIYGQWGHNTPDGACMTRTEAWATAPCRMDWAEILLRWYDRYLKGDTSKDLGPAIQVQDNVGYWRNADSYPPAAPAWTELHLRADGGVGGGAGTPTDVQLMPGTPVEGGTVLEFVSPVLEEDLRFSGLPQVRLPFTATASGGQLAVWLRDLDERGYARAPNVGCDPKGRCLAYDAFGGLTIGHGQMNLRFHAGGEQQQTVVPGQRYVAKMELEPLDVMIPRGHRLQVLVFQGQFADHDPTATPSPITLHLDGEAFLRLPVIEVDPTTIFPVPGVKMPARELYSHMHLPIVEGPSTRSLPAIVPVGAEAETPENEASADPADQAVPAAPASSGPSGTAPRCAAPVHVPTPATCRS